MQSVIPHMIFAFHMSILCDYLNFLKQSKKKGLSLEEKRTRMMEIFFESVSEFLCRWKKKSVEVRGTEPSLETISIPKHKRKGTNTAMCSYCREICLRRAHPVFYTTLHEAKSDKAVLSLEFLYLRIF